MPDQHCHVYQPPQRLLMGPGPSQVDPCVYLAMAAPTIGHTDPAFFSVLKDVQPAKAICEAAHAAGALVIADCVTSLGMPVEVDRNGIDVAYSGSQKCRSCPPGLTPLTLSPNALEELRKRETKCVSWYLDLKLFGPLAGEALRVGLVGASSSRNNVLPLLQALERALRASGYAGYAGDAAGAASAAEAFYHQQSRQFAA